MKQFLQNYSYDAASNQLTFNNLIVPPERILLVATGGTVLYSLADGVGYAGYSTANGNTLLTLQPPPSYLGLTNYSKFTISYDDGVIQTNTVTTYSSTAPTLLAGSTNNPLQADQHGNLNVNVAAGTINATSAAVYNTFKPTLTGGTTNPLQSDVSGNLKIDIANSEIALATNATLAPGQSLSSAGNVTLSAANCTLPVSGNFYQSNQPVSLTANHNGTPTNVQTDSLGNLTTSLLGGSVALAGGTATIGSVYLSTNNGGLGASSNAPMYESIVGGNITSAIPIGNITTTGGTAVTTPGGAQAIAGTSVSNMLVIQNTGTAGNLYLSVITGSATVPSSQAMALSPGMGYEFPVLPGASQYVYLQGAVSGISYSLIYA